MSSIRLQFGDRNHPLRKCKRRTSGNTLSLQGSESNGDDSSGTRALRLMDWTLRKDIFGCFRLYCSSRIFIWRKRPSGCYFQVAIHVKFNEWSSKNKIGSWSFFRINTDFDTVVDGVSVCVASSYDDHLEWVRQERDHWVVVEYGMLHLESCPHSNSKRLIAKATLNGVSESVRWNHLLGHVESSIPVVLD